MEELQIKKRIFLSIIEYIALIAIKLIFLTCKKTFVGGELPEKPCIVVFWHGRLAMMAFAYKRWWLKSHKGKKSGKVIISDHKDGEIITRVISHFGIGAIRGSSSKNAVKALVNAFNEIKNGVDVIITPDGPRGPIHSVADGAVIIAQKKNLEIYALNYEASRFWQFKSWDKMVLPKPFSHIRYSLSEAINIQNLSIEDAKETIKNRLFLSKEQDEFKKS